MSEDLTFEETLSAIDRSRSRYLAAQHRLYNVIVDLCPGPHTPKQHRDGKPPWCNSCGYTNEGEHNTDISFR